MSFDFAIATTTYFGTYGNCRDPRYRLKLFLEEAESVARLDWQNGVWVIHDDASPVEFPALPQMNCEVIVVGGDKRLTNAGRIPKAISHAVTLAPWVLALDSDGLLSRNCIQRIRWLQDKFPEQGVFGTFDTKYHPDVETHGGYVMKRSLPEHGLVFRSDLWQVPYRDGFGLLSNIRCDGYSPYPCLSPSGVQHTGRLGLNGASDDYDPMWRP